MSAVRPFAIAVVLSVASCSSSGLHPAAGRLTVKGKPADGALVSFHPDGVDPTITVPAIGLVGADGAFTLSTNGLPGAAAGPYTITVIWPEPPPELKAGAKPKNTADGMPGGGDRPDRLGGRYANKATSTLKREIKAGANALDPIDLN